MMTADTLRSIATRTESDIDYVLALIQSMIIDSAIEGNLKRTVSFNTCAFKDNKLDPEIFAYDVAKILRDSGYKVKARIFMGKYDNEYLSFDISWKD